MRLYELAKALKINSKALVTCCQDLGNPVKNHMSVIPEDIWNKIQDRLKVPPEKRVEYIHEVVKPKKKPASKKATSITKKVKKTKDTDAPEAEVTEDEAGEDDKKDKLSGAQRDRFVRSKEKIDKLKKAKSNVDVAVPKTSGKEEVQGLREDKIVAKTGGKSDLINKKQAFKGTDVFEEEKSKVEKLRQRYEDRQGLRDEMRTGPVSSRTRNRQAMQNRVASRRGRRRKRRGEIDKVDALHVQLPKTLKALSSELKIRSNEIINRLRHHDGTTLDIDDYLTEDNLINIGLIFEIEITIEHEVDREHELLDMASETDEEAFLIQEDNRYTEERPPVVTILGHVDHGKTSLLDFIRKSRVAVREAGGITQHIGAYQVEHNKKKVTFIDTPGHQVFTEMRARGAQCTDIIILVVAADDGIMPQTQESIQHAKAAGVPIIVAVNKMDLPGADLEKVKQQLTQYELITEEWGGDTIICPVSAISGEGIDHLLDMILIQAEVQELKANKDLPQSYGIVLESSMSNQKGVITSVLVQNGTLKKGAIVACGTAHGKIRAIVDENGEQLTEAGPSRPVQIYGLDVAPEVAAQFHSVSDLTKAREIVKLRSEKVKALESDEGKTAEEAAPEFNLDSIFDTFDQQELTALALLVKADVKGSLEALLSAIESLAANNVPIKIVGKGVGGINESDVLLAKVSNATIMGFNVVADATARKAGKSNKIDIHLHRVIYELLDQVKEIMQGLVGTTTREEEIGQAEVRGIFKSSKHGMICGCLVTNGVVKRGCNVRVSRDGVVIHYGRVETLRRIKDDAREVREGLECGMRVKDYDDIKEGDSIHFFESVEVAGNLE